jgi:hypothetical protein
MTFVKINSKLDPNRKERCVFPVSPHIKGIVTYQSNGIPDRIKLLETIHSETIHSDNSDGALFILSIGLFICWWLIWFNFINPSFHQYIILVNISLWMGYEFGEILVIRKYIINHV